ncbi:MAG: trigger factor [Lachnospiraceae bacterium]|nr:trigger factor [Lachnospiraceae bacterium]
MSVTVENLEKNMAKLTITVAASEVDKAMQSVYIRNKSRYSVPGFRKGKASRAMLEKMYGKGLFLEDAVNNILPAEYSKAVDESGVDVVSEPQIDFVQVDPEQDLVFTATVAVKPPVELGQYKGVEIPKADLEVTEAEVNDFLKREAEKNATNKTVEDRAAKDGDIATIDFDGSVDGVAFDGGKGENYPLTIGSGTFIPGFEEQIVGHNVGDTFDVNVTFPENYNASELAGKAAVFACRLNKLEEKVLPEIDDEFASEVSEFETLDEYKAHIEKTEKEKKEIQAERSREAAAVRAAVANAAIEVPEPMIDTEAKQMVDEFAQNLQAQGMQIEQYLQYFGQTQDQMVESMKGRAEERIRERLVLEAVGKAENIEVSEEEITEEISKMAENYQMEAEEIRSIINDAYLKEDIVNRKVRKMLAEAAVEVEKAEEAE